MKKNLHPFFVQREFNSTLNLSTASNKDIYWNLFYAALDYPFGQLAHSHFNHCVEHVNVLLERAANNDHSANQCLMTLKKSKNVFPELFLEIEKNLAQKKRKITP